MWSASPLPPTLHSGIIVTVSCGFTIIPNVFSDSCTSRECWGEDGDAVAAPVPTKIVHNERDGEIQDLGRACWPLFCRQRFWRPLPVGSKNRKKLQEWTVGRGVNEKLSPDQLSIKAVTKHLGVSSCCIYIYIINSIKSKSRTVIIIHGLIVLQTEP
jgi:hypothetical protein